MPITPSINSNYSNLSSGLTSPAPNFPMNFNPSQPMNNFPSRANMQRRFSQPINSMDMSQFMHPYKQMHRSRGLGGRMQNPIFNNELSSQFRIQEEEEDTFMENNNNNNNNTMNTITSIAPMNPFNYTMGNNNHSTIPMTNLDTNSISALSLESLSNNDNNLNNLNNQSHMINSTMTMNSLNNNNNSNLQQRFNTNFDHDFLIPQSASNNFIKQNQSFGPRRHSLADPYSLQRFQAMKFGIGPFAMNSTTQSSNSPFEFNNQLNENSLFQLNNVNNNNSNNNGQMSYMMNNNVNNFMENEIYNSNNNHQNNNNNNNNNTNFNNHFNNNFMNANNNNNTQPGTSFNFVEANFNYNNNNNTNSNHNNNDLLLSATSNLNTSNYLNEDFNYLQ
ncbi:hypothetical protein K502DRAFT_358457 [Neoconidiobolus thromboides FSU 785]|nr:hypothetical protein K502DRAFT_358457 [Neoconidiobolus thromboides FSU 785]